MSRAGIPFLWLCGPSGVGKSAVGYEIFQQVYRSGIKASFMDFDQLGLCYPSPVDDPDNHQVKAQNLAAVWPTYRTAGARCLVAVGGVRPLNLNLLGLVVTLNQVNLNITAVPGAGNLLGNLLCSVANLLNGGGSLSTIADLLNQILALL